MDATTITRLDALRQLTLSEVNQRIAEIDIERDSLVVIQKAMIRRERTKQRSARARDGRCNA